MKLKEKLTKPLYQNSFDGDSEHTYIRFENIDVVLSKQEDIVKKYTIEFYKYMDDNYKRIGDGYVTKLGFDKNPIVTIEKALEEYDSIQNR